MGEDLSSHTVKGRGAEGAGQWGPKSKQSPVSRVR